METTNAQRDVIEQFLSLSELAGRGVRLRSRLTIPITVPRAKSTGRRNTL